MFALLLFSSGGLSDKYNTPFHLLSVSAPGAVGHAICGLDGWDGWMDASVLIQHTNSGVLGHVSTLATIAAAVRSSQASTRFLNNLSLRKFYAKTSFCMFCPIHCDQQVSLLVGYTDGRCEETQVEVNWVLGGTN